MTDLPTPEEFREVGYLRKPKQNYYLLTERAYQWLLQFNGVPVGHKVPRAWKYAPNKWVQATMETYASEAGL